MSLFWLVVLLINYIFRAGALRWDSVDNAWEDVLDTIAKSISSRVKMIVFDTDYTLYNGEFGFWNNKPGTNKEGRTADFLPLIPRWLQIMQQNDIRIGVATNSGLHIDEIMALFRTEHNCPEKYRNEEMGIDCKPSCIISGGNPGALWSRLDIDPYGSNKEIESQKLYYYVNYTIPDTDRSHVKQGHIGTTFTHYGTWDHKGQVYTSISEPTIEGAECGKIDGASPTEQTGCTLENEELSEGSLQDKLFKEWANSKDGTKETHLRWIIENCGIERESIVFVDDSPKYIKTASDLQIPYVLANAWKKIRKGKDKQGNPIDLDGGFYPIDFKIEAHHYDINNMFAKAWLQEQGGGYEKAVKEALKREPNHGEPVGDKRVAGAGENTVSWKPPVIGEVVGDDDNGGESETPVDCCRCSKKGANGPATTMKPNPDGKQCSELADTSTDETCDGEALKCKTEGGHLVEVGGTAEKAKDESGGSSAGTQPNQEPPSETTGACCICRKEGSFIYEPKRDSGCYGNCAEAGAPCTITGDTAKAPEAEFEQTCCDCAEGAQIAPAGLCPGDCEKKIDGCTVKDGVLKLKPGASDIGSKQPPPDASDSDREATSVACCICDADGVIAFGNKDRGECGEICKDLTEQCPLKNGLPQSPPDSTQGCCKCTPEGENPIFRMNTPGTECEDATYDKYTAGQCEPVSGGCKVEDGKLKPKRQQ